MSEDINKEIEEFIAENRKLKAADIALQLSKKKHLPSSFILNQINGLQKSEKKFPFLLDYPKYIFPPSISISQASSSETARYKASLFEKLGKIADLSGGMGIDTFFLSQKAEGVDYVESRAELFEITQKNFRVLGADNINCHHTSAENFLGETNKNYGLIYLDPDRRKEGKRLVQLKDCSPNAAEIYDNLINKSDSLLFKYSPMLDISSAIQELREVKEVHILSIQNEVKELLFLVQKGYLGEAKIKAVDMSNAGKSIFEFKIIEERSAIANYSAIDQYLYEPNSAILKAGAFNLISEQFKLNKLAPNTHLYSSKEFVSNFPGRKLKVMGISKKASDLSKKANIVSRNSGLSVEEIKKKFKIKEGGEEFIYAFRDLSGKRFFCLAELLS